MFSKYIKDKKKYSELNEIIENAQDNRNKFLVLPISKHPCNIVSTEDIMLSESIDKTGFNFSSLHLNYSSGSCYFIIEMMEKIELILDKSNFDDIKLNEINNNLDKSNVNNIELTKINKN